MTRPDFIARIVIVAPIAVHYDAISNAARNLYLMVKDQAGLEVDFITSHNEFSDVPARIVPGVGALLLDRAFRAADLVIYGFGVFHPFLDAVLVGNGHGKQIVRFHNITPAALVDDTDRPLIEMSFRQLHNLRHADHVWSDSRTNADVLLAHGVDPARIEVLPLAVDRPSPALLQRKSADPIDVVFVGRGVAAKGLLDGINALGKAIAAGAPPVRLSIVCNMMFSDQRYIARCRDAVAGLGLQDVVTFCGTVDDDGLGALYHKSHVLLIPSYHEGFCVPVIEALRAGCIPIGYAAGNLPDIVAGLGCLVPTGDIDALGASLTRLLQRLRDGLGDISTPMLPLDRGAMSVRQFDQAAQVYVQTYSFERIARTTMDRVRTLAFSGDQGFGRRFGIRPEFSVLPDDAMRELTRTSLNRLPDPSDWTPGEPLSDLMRDMRQPVCIHRKSWEYAICLKGLADLGVVDPTASGLAVGAGSETPLFWYANQIKRMVATDLYANPDHEGNPAMLANPKAFAPFPYREDHLDVLRMPGDALDFPDGTFDFVFCLSSIEHFGSRATQRKSLDEMARVLRPGGIACIITELILTDHTDDEYFRWEEIERVFFQHPRLELVGGEPDLSISVSQVAYPVDLINTRHPSRSPHIVLKRGEMLWTSFSMFLRRTG